MQTTSTAPATDAARNSKLQEFFVDQLQDMYWAEQKLVKTLPKMEEAASAGELRQAFNSHLQETKNHVSRLEKVFGLIGVPAEAKKCHAIAGIADEGEEIIDETDENTAQRDVGHRNLVRVQPRRASGPINPTSDRNAASGAGRCIGTRTQNRTTTGNAARAVDKNGWPSGSRFWMKTAGKSMTGPGRPDDDACGIGQRGRGT